MKRDRKVIQSGHKPRKHTVVFADKRNKRGKRDKGWKNEVY